MIELIWNGVSFDVHEQGKPHIVGCPAFVPANEFDDSKRSSGWHKVQVEVVTAHPFCSVCGLIKELQVHHVKPFHLFPELELIITNLVVLCRRDHFIFGHLFDWKAYNPAVLEDINIWLEKLKGKPYV